MAVNRQAGVCLGGGERRRFDFAVIYVDGDG